MSTPDENSITLNEALEIAKGSIESAHIHLNEAVKRLKVAQRQIVDEDKYSFSEQYMIDSRHARETIRVWRKAIKQVMNELETND